MDVVINSECDFIPEQSKLFVSQSSAVLNFLVSLGYDAYDPPIAEVLKREHNLEGKWVNLSPIQWYASHNDAMIVATGKELQLNEAQSKNWFELYAHYLAGENKSIYYHNSEIWLLCTDNMPPLRAKPAHILLNQSLMPELAQLDATMYWQKFFTESQMFFASLQNKSLLNGIWPWGGADLVSKKAIKVCADEYFYSMAQTCSSDVTLYSPSVSLKQFQILLIDNLSKLDPTHEEQLQKLPVRWYWNNAAYSVNHTNWFIRLWRKLTHAY